MDQSNLLELAKQGEPIAIAALMNAVLEPTGIMAQARLETDCLWVALESPKALNPETLMTFIRHGLLELGNESIRLVKVQGRKIGESSFAWTREFEIHPAKPSLERREEGVSQIGSNEQSLPSVGAVALQEKPEILKESENTEPLLKGDVQLPIEPEPFSSVELEPPSLEITSLSSLEKLLEVSEVEVASIAAEPHKLDAPSEALSEAADQAQCPQIEPMTLAETPEMGLTVADPEIEADPEAEEPTDEDSAESALTLRGWIKTHWRAYSLPVLFVVVTGFVLGSATAFWLTSQTQGKSALPQENTVENKQKEAENYLKAMNSAQVAFYEKNNRFATSLEELERSANLIAQSYSYAYQIRVSDRALITALPRETGLKSYIGMVSAAPAGATSLICQSIKPSMQVPTAPALSKKKAATCAPRSVKVP